MSDSPVCILSIDVEDWFHLIGAGLDYQFKQAPGGCDTWDRFPPRVEENTRWILDTLDQRQVKATFFVLGWVAERYPKLVAEIHQRGHEVASHSYWHKLVPSQTPDQFRADLRRSVNVLQNITGSQVVGFRASTASITDWAIEIIKDEGLRYDSSLFPVSYHDVYGKLTGINNQQLIERLPNGLLEVKLTSLHAAGLQLPWSGGGYFRLLPYLIFRAGMRHILREKGIFHFFIHPWELDRNPPKLANLKRTYYLRRYLSISRTRRRFERLLAEHRFVPIRQALQESGCITA